MPIILLISLLITGGAGAMIAADDALPGDRLYTVKININEELRSALAVSTAAQGNVDVARAEARLQEAALLVKEDRFTVETASALTEDFKENVDNAQISIEKLIESNNSDIVAEISSNLEVALRAHEQVLVKIAQEKPEAAERIETFLATIRPRLDLASKLRATAEGKIVTNEDAAIKQAAENSLTLAQNKVDEVRSLVSRSASKIGDESRAEADARLQVAQGLIMEGRAELNNNEYVEAFKLFQLAQRATKEARVLVRAIQDLDIGLTIAPLYFDVAVDGDAIGGPSGALEINVEAQVENQTGQQSQKSDDTQDSNRAEGDTKTEVEVDADNDSLNTEIEGELEVEVY